jgi:hypothetical protein
MHHAADSHHWDILDQHSSLSSELLGDKMVEKMLWRSYHLVKALDEVGVRRLSMFYMALVVWY